MREAQIIHLLTVSGNVQRLPIQVWCFLGAREYRRLTARRQTVGHSAPLVVKKTRTLYIIVVQHSTGWVFCLSQPTVLCQYTLPTPTRLNCRVESRWRQRRWGRTRSVHDHFGTSGDTASVHRYELLRYMSVTASVHRSYDFGTHTSQNMDHFGTSTSVHCHICQPTNK